MKTHIRTHRKKAMERQAEIRVMNGVTTKEHPGLPRVNQMLVKVRKDFPRAIRESVAQLTLDFHSGV